MHQHNYINTRPRVTGLLKLVDAWPYAAGSGERDLPCPFWKNPDSKDFRDGLENLKFSCEGLRAIVTERDLYVWQSNDLLHADFVRRTGFDGVRVGLRQRSIEVNQETVAFPEEFPWIFTEAEVEEMDDGQRHSVIVDWLLDCHVLNNLYPNGFLTTWYM